jgi:hypothetical protein
MVEKAAVENITLKVNIVRQLAEGNQFYQTNCATREKERNLQLFFQNNASIPVCSGDGN